MSGSSSNDHSQDGQLAACVGQGKMPKARQYFPTGARAHELHDGILSGIESTVVGLFRQCWLLRLECIPQIQMTARASRMYKATHVCRGCTAPLPNPCKNLSEHRSHLILLQGGDERAMLRCKLHSLVSQYTSGIVPWPLMDGEYQCCQMLNGKVLRPRAPPHKKMTCFCSASAWICSEL